MDLDNCPNCGNIYVKNTIRDCCDACYKKEEADYDRVYRFLRKRENRAATMETVAKATDVEEYLLQKWVKKGRLQVAQFPNLGFPCDRCGTLITKGKICENCATSIKQELSAFENEKNRQDQLHTAVYHSQDLKK
ncbi:YvyF [Lederbergia lenta]|uniref:YvyF n=2 Tax=Lederbergia lenta TaxID=1467 RepID=A0A2X4WGQ6_LEDLE|nr:TIGR03826 family flagellar region protein [Lederbergia lenta]SQI62019.1 YvyF [Lederbergia lenta]